MVRKWTQVNPQQRVCQRLGRTMVISEQPAQPFSALDRLAGFTGGTIRIDQSVA